MSHPTEHRRETADDTRADIQTPTPEDLRADIYGKEPTFWDKHAKTRGQKFGAMALGMTLFLGAGAGTGALLNKSQNTSEQPAPQPTIDAPVTPGEVITPEVSETVSFPEEARGFIEEFGTQYTGPLATYRAEQSYAQNNDGLASTLGNNWISSYESTNNIMSPSSELFYIQFTQLALDTPIKNETVVDILNNPQTTESIDRYMNLIARNPSPEAIAAIDNEFIKYTGRNNPDAANLLDSLKEVVSTHGNAANYSLAPAALSSDTEEGTTVFTYNEAAIDDMSDDGLVRAFNSNVTLRFDVESFESDGSSSVERVSGDERISLSIKRVTPSGPTDPGIIGIGEK